MSAHSKATMTSRPYSMGPGGGGTNRPNAQDSPRKLIRQSRHREVDLVSVTLDDQAQRGAYWPLPLARAIPAAALAIVITFSADHSAGFGLLAFGAFAVVTGALILSIAARRLVASGVRSYLVAQGAVTVLAGAGAFGAASGGVPAFFLAVTSWAAITGGLELYSGFRSRGRFVASADWLIVGGITAIVALVFVLLPPDFRDEFVGEQRVSGILDSSIIAVGLLGAYAAVIAVFLVIAGLSARWGTTRTDAAAPATAPGAGRAPAPGSTAPPAPITAEEDR